VQKKAAEQPPLDPFCQVASSQKLLAPGEALERQAVQLVRQSTRRLTVKKSEPAGQPFSWSSPPSRRIEMGSALRLLEKSASAGAIPERGQAFGDPLEKVAQGLDTLKGPMGPFAVTKQRRAARRLGAVLTNQTKLMPQVKPVLESLWDENEDEDMREQSKCSQSAAMQESSMGALAASVSSEGRARRRTDTRGRLVVIAEFNHWCRQTFGSLQEAWRRFVGGGTFGSSGAVTKEQFVNAMRTHGYPMGTIGAKTVFFFLDTDDDGLIALEDLTCGVENVVQEKKSTAAEAWAALHAEEDRARETADLDPMEEHLVRAVSSAGGSVSLDRARSKILARLNHEDPPVAELMAYLFESFRTLRMAFRQMDANKNGLLTKTEFTEGMATIRSKTGVKPLESHVGGLFDRLDTNGAGVVGVEELLERAFGKGVDPFLERLGDFLADHTNDGDHIPTRRKKLQGLFRLRDGEKMSCADFAQELAKLRYHDWHINDLFSRLDKDCSGSLSIGEFTAFLEKEVPKRVPMANDDQPLISAQHSTAGSSPKLQQCGHRGWHSPTGSSGVLATSWRTEDLGFALKYERPDWVELVRGGISERQARRKRAKSSDLKTNGQHVLVGHPDRVPDLIAPRVALQHFDTELSRTCVDTA